MRVDPDYIKILLRLGMLLFLFILPLFFFGLIIHEVLIERGGQFDAIIFHFFENITSPGMTDFMSFITFFGSTRFLVATYTLLVIWFMVKRKFVLTKYIVAVGFSSFFFLRLIKILLNRHRPSDPLIDTTYIGYSFPSGHASSSVIFAGLLICLVWQEPVSKKIKLIISLLLLLFSFLIGLSRIYLRMHYASDVLAGFCLGFIWLNFSVIFLLFSRRRNNHIFNKQHLFH